MPRTDGNSGTRATYLARGSAAPIFPAGKTALLVIDPVNDFLSEGGAAYEETKGTLKLHNVIEHLKQVIAGARARGIPVFFGPMAFTEQDYAVEALQRRSAINRFMFEKRMFLAGSWGADFHPEIQPQEGDVILLPHKSIDVFETDLPEQLARRNITHLVIAGMTANLCCESTGRHAMERGYDVTYLSDAIGSTNVPSYEAAVHINYPLISNGVMKVEEFLAALDASAQRDSAASEGDTVYGSDHGKLGEVSKVVRADDAGLSHLVVPRGIFQSDLFIPLGAIVRRAGTSVFINVPKLVVAKMPWSEAPTREGNEEKYGPPEDEVRRLYGSRAPSIEGEDVQTAH